MKTTVDRLRESLEQHFGVAHMRVVAADQDLFADAYRPMDGGRALGDNLDRIEMLLCIETEFGVILPDDDAHGVVTLEALAEKIDAALESRGDQ